MAKKNPWGLPTQPFDPRGLFAGATNGPAAPDFFAPLAKSGLAGTTQPRGGSGGNPYGGILNEYLNSSKARFAADSAADAASRDAALRRYFISYGDIPDFDQLGISDSARGFLGKAIDQKTRDLAAKNMAEGTAVAAREQKADAVARRRIPAQLAARGMLRSGQTGSDLMDQQQMHKNTVFDQLNELLGGVEGTVGNFLQAERARQDALAQAMLQAQMAAAGEYGGSMYGDEAGANGSWFTGNTQMPGMGEGWAGGSPLGSYFSTSASSRRRTRPGRPVTGQTRRGQHR